MVSSSFFSCLLFIAVLLASNKHGSAVEDSGGFHAYERDALLALKAGFNNSFLNTNWTGIMCYMNETPFWHGIQCIDGRVSGVILESMRLFGEIKVDAFVNLSEVSNLSFKNNFLTGNVMDFTNNPKLRYIDLSYNRFQGEIPPSLIHLDSLESLLLQHNNLTGPIPGFNQATLKTFNVSNNNLSGKIPTTKVLQSFGFSSYAGNENLCGPPTPSICNATNEILSDQSKIENSGEDGNHNSHIESIMVVVNVIVLVVIMFLFIIYYRKYKKLKKQAKEKNFLPKDEEDDDNEVVERKMEKRAHEGEDGKLVFVDDNNDNNQARFELDDLLKASAEGLGRGNFGTCYKAIMEIGQAVVVKKFVDLKPLSSDEFIRQVKAIGGVRHPNLLPLLGYYYSKDEKLFLYRFAANGNVYNRLHGGRGTEQRVAFRWSSRLAVARGVARAVEHLHRQTRSQNIAPHGNLKPSNVLLGENEEVLVADYGLTSLVAVPVAQRMVAYKTPEYESNKRISKKSDVWSYGCLLLELLTGRIAAHSAPPGSRGVDLCGWVNRAVREEWTAEIFDPEIAVQKDANRGMLKLMRIAMKCCENSPEKRPEISQVVAEMEEVEVSVDSEEDELSYSSLDRSVTDDSLAVVVADDRR